MPHFAIEKRLLFFAFRSLFLFLDYSSFLSFFCIGDGLGNSLLTDAHIVTGLEIGVCVRVADLRFPVDGKVQCPQMDGFIPFHILGVPVTDQLEIVIGMGDFRIQPVLEILLLFRRNIELHRAHLTAAYSAPSCNIGCAAGWPAPQGSG